MADISAQTKTGTAVVLPTLRNLGALTLLWKDNGVTAATPTVNFANAYQLGGYMVLKFHILQSNNGGTSNYVAELPSGYNLATTLLATNGANTGHLGTVTYFDGTSRLTATATRFAGTTNQFFFVTSSGTAITSAAMNAASRYIEGTLTIPITELILTEMTSYGNGLATGDNSGLVSKEEAFTHSTTLQGNGGGTVSSTASVLFRRVGGQVTMTFPTVTDATPAGATTYLVLNTAFPARFRPSVAINTIEHTARIRNNGTVQTTGFGLIQITSAGEVFIYRDPSGVTAYTNAAGAGVQGFSISWAIV